MENLRASWEAAYSLFWSKFDNCFTYAKTAVRARAYVGGLMSGIERKNGWQLAEYIGDEAPYAVQNFLSRAMWDADMGNVVPVGKKTKMVALSVGESRRFLVELMRAAKSSLGYYLHWMRWRRIHQATAQQCHFKSQTTKMQL